MAHEPLPFDLPLNPDPPKAFVSYSSHDRAAAGRCKIVLESLGVPAFTAHDDLDVSVEWRDEIVRELRASRIFVPLLSAHFRESAWASQEIGFACCRDMEIIPISLDRTIPYGFIQHIQSRPAPTPREIDAILTARVTQRHPRTAAPALIRALRDADGFRIAESLMKPLVPLFGALEAHEATALAVASINNGQIWDAGDCATAYLPEFLQQCGAMLPDHVREVLAYQVEHRQWHHLKDVHQR